MVVEINLILKTSEHNHVMDVIDNPSLLHMLIAIDLNARVPVLSISLQILQI